jgi:hypothetical protein
MIYRAIAVAFWICGFEIWCVFYLHMTYVCPSSNNVHEPDRLDVTG